MACVKHELQNQEWTNNEIVCTNMKVNNINFSCELYTTLTTVDKDLPLHYYILVDHMVF